MKHKIKIRNTLAIIFIVFSLFLTMIMSILLNIGINSSFDKYLVTKNQQYARIIQEEEAINNIQPKSNLGLMGASPNRQYQLNSVEIDLQKSINRYSIIIGIFSFIISIAIAFFISKKITSPLSRIEEATKKIKEDNYNIEIKEDTNIEELSTLIVALENMGKKISENIEHDKRLSQDVQHELRTPLTNIKVQIEAMLDGIWEINEENLALCLSEIDRLNSIVNQLHQLGVIEEELTFSKIIIKETVDKIIRENSLSLEKKNMSVTNLIDENLIIKSDEFLLRTAIFNLITNSIRYSGENSNIKVKYKEFNGDLSSYKNSEIIKNNINHEKNYYIISVIDNGCGIPKEQLDKIFDRFYRVDKSRSRQLGGAGLGLSIVSAVANRLGGFVYVESEENIQTNFSLFLENMVIKG